MLRTGFIGDVRSPMSPLRRVILLIAVLLILSSSVWLIGGMLGFLSTEVVVVGGQSGLKTIGSISVAGCLLAAIASWKN